MRHDPSAIWAHLSKTLAYFLELCPSATAVHLVSDGPTTQYRSKNNFYYLSTLPFEMCLQRITWNFLEAKHGKDGVGAAVKRRADEIVAQGKDLPNAKTM
jgi:hypothetical protein